MIEPIFQFTDELIQSYVDDELDAETRTEFELHLKDNPEVSDQVKIYLSYNEDLRKLFNPVLDEPIPEEILLIPDQPRKITYLAQAAVLVMTLSIGLIAGWIGNGQFRPVDQIVLTQTETLVDDAFAYHAVYTPEVRHPVEVGADNQEHLFKWLSKRLKTDISAPSLDAIGFELLGGRLLQTGDKPAALFMYENTQGQRLTLFARQKMKTELLSSFRYAKQDRQNAFYWIGDKLSFVLIGEVTKPELSKAVHSVYNSLSI